MGGRRWTKYEIQFLRKYYSILTPKEIAEVLGRTTESVKKKAERLGLRSPYEGRLPTVIRKLLEEYNKRYKCRSIRNDI